MGIKDLDKKYELNEIVSGTQFSVPLGLLLEILLMVLR